MGGTGAETWRQSLKVISNTLIYRSDWHLSIYITSANHLLFELVALLSRVNDKEVRMT